MDPLRCAWCDQKFGSRSRLNDHEDSHTREERRHYWRARLVKNGPTVGAVTWFGPPLVDGEEQDRSPRWQCAVNGETTGRAVLQGDHLPIEVDGLTLRNLEPTTAAEYQFLTADAAHAAAHRPEHPKASPRQAVDFNRLKPF